MQNNLIVSPTALTLAVVLVMIALAINFKEKIGLERDLVIGVVRAVIQLTVVGYVLTYIIRVDRLWLTALMVAIIIGNAAVNARGRANGIPHAGLISLVAISVATLLTLGFLLIAHAIAFIPSQVVPITGMIASNVMVAIGLCYRQLECRLSRPAPSHHGALSVRRRSKTSRHHHCALSDSHWDGADHRFGQNSGLGQLTRDDERVDFCRGRSD
jgi:uncharacterized protein (TIGR00245 family)